MREAQQYLILKDLFIMNDYGVLAFRLLKMIMALTKTAASPA
jgi:hypothetical protein